MRVYPLKYCLCVFITGGRINDVPTNLAEMVDVGNPSDAELTLPPMLLSRSDHALAATGSSIFAFGGYNERNERTSSCEFYDVRINR